MKNRNVALKAISASLISLCLIGSPQHALAGGPMIAAQAAASQPVLHLIVKLKTPTPGGNVMSAAQAAGISAIAGVALTPHRAMSDDAQVVALPAKMTYAQADAIAQKLMQNPSVQYAEPDVIVTPQLVPNDPLFVNQWAYFAPSGALPYVAAGGANLINAWAQTTGVALNSTVAVIDTGYLPHPDLTGKILSGYDFITDPIIANDGNGRDARALDPGDWTAFSNSSWHGTHVAGTIGAATNNLAGVAGTNWNARIVPVRVLGKGGGMMSDVIDGMRWAAGLAVVGVPANANPAKVLNMSLGGGGACGAATQTAINQIIAAGSVIVVAAGNSNANASTATPANCAGVIVVAANNRLGKRAYYSNYGALVTIAAPGGDMTVDTGILSTLNAGTTVPAAYTYAYYQGTSMATPHVAGIVSLMRSVRPLLTPAQIKNILMGTARPFPVGSTCNTSLCGAGIVDANAAVTASRGLSRVLFPTPASINFGAVAIGTIKSSIVNIVNGGLINAAITTVTPPAGFTATGCAGLTLLPGASCALTVGFAPLVAGVKSGTIAVASNSLKPVSIPVAATGYNPALEVFPAGGVMPVGWINSPGSSAIWRVASDTAFQGALSLKSGIITHGQNSSIQVTRTARPAGNVTFALRVSSELSFDFLQFYVDGALKGSWSGNQPWLTVSYPVTAGTHIFKWSYIKDVTVSAGSDAAWIDAVVLP